jgi:hypothetical protein
MDNKFKEFLFLLLLGVFTISFSWYRNINHEKEIVVTKDIMIENPVNIIQNYNDKKTYYYRNELIYNAKRTLVPFVYDRTLVKVKKPQIYTE